MNRRFIRIIAALIISAMALAAIPTTVLADGELVNLYDASKAEIGTPPASATGAASYNANYYSSAAIEVNAGDKIYFGPIFKDQGYYLTSYNVTGSVVKSQIKLADVETVGDFGSNALIACWTVPSGVSQFRIATSQMFYDSTLITKNQPYDAEDYFKYMEAQKVNVDYLKVTESTEELKNVFPVSDKSYAGRVDATGAEIASTSYTSSDYIAVKPGDVIYFAAAVSTQGYHLALQDENKKGTTTVNSKYMVEYEDLGRGYVTYSYRIRPGTAYVRVVAATGVYEDGSQLVTINQPFSGEQYRKLFNINISDEPTDPDSPLNGLKALFMGDSISYGAGDSLSYTRIGSAWAGRIQAATGLIATNASVSGAKASYVSGDDTTKWLYKQFEANKNGEFDVIVMHGGVNDARHNRGVGTILDSNDDTTLKAAVNTYAGGLQYLFHNVRTTFPEATLFFIANHRLDGHSTGNAKDMSAYFNIAKELCEKYDIIFIDLYNNEELNTKLETTTTKYLPDTLHLNAAGYEIITPYIISALEEGIKTNTETTVEETTPTDDPVTNVPTDAAESTEAPETNAPSSEGGCGSVAGGSAAAITAIAAAVLVIKKKKED